MVAALPSRPSLSLPSSSSSSSGTHTTPFRNSSSCTCQMSQKQTKVRITKKVAGKHALVKHEMQKIISHENESTRTHTGRILHMASHIGTHVAHVFICTKHTPTCCTASWRRRACSPKLLSAGAKSTQVALRFSGAGNLWRYACTRGPRQAWARSRQSLWNSAASRGNVVSASACRWGT